MNIDEVVRSLFPIRSEWISLELAPAWTDENTGEVQQDVWSDQGVGVLVRLIVWDEVDGDRSIRDVKEQQVTLVYQRHAEDPRVVDYARGWAAALSFALGRVDELRAAGAPLPRFAAELDAWMPMDLFFPDLLALRRPQTEDDFMDALLSSKKRLGKLLP